MALKQATKHLFLILFWLLFVCKDRKVAFIYVYCRVFDQDCYQDIHRHAHTHKGNHTHTHTCAPICCVARVGSLQPPPAAVVEHVWSLTAD